MADNFSLSDIAAVSGNDNGWGGGNAWVLIILFALIFGNGGFGFGGGGDRAATAGDVQRAVDNASMSQDIQRTAYENMAVTKDAAYNNLSEIRDVQTQLNAGFANMANCCCELKGSILENRYLSAQNTAAINANTTAAVQKVLDTIQADKIASLTAEVSDLKVQNMFCGIPRINPFGYGVYPYPTCSSSTTTTTTA